MTWPDDGELDIEVSAAFGANVTADPATWNWTDLSDRLLDRPITSVRGSASGGGLRSSSLTLALRNDDPDGALTPLHPMSPYWPNVVLGTPVRVRVRPHTNDLGDVFNRTSSSGWGDATSGQTWSLIGAGGTILLTDWTVSGGKGVMSVPVANAYRTAYPDPFSVADLELTATVTSAITDVTGGSLEPLCVQARGGPGGFYLFKVVRNTAETISAQLVAPSLATLANVQVYTSAQWTPGEDLSARVRLDGGRLRFKVWRTAVAEPSAWNIDVVNHEYTGPGTVGVRSGVASGNTNTLPVVFRWSNISVTPIYLRGAGFADSWQPTFLPTTNPGETVSAVQITASGITRRMGQGTSPVLSPLRRTIADSRPAAYWPVEDGAAAGQAGSVIPGHPPMSVIGDVVFRPIEEFLVGGVPNLKYGTSALADLSLGGTLRASVPADVTAATATAWTVHCWADIDPFSLNQDMEVLDWNTAGGLYTRWTLVVTTGFLVQVFGVTPANVSNLLFTTSASGGFGSYAVGARQVGGSFQVTLYLDGVLINTTTIPGTIAGLTGIASNTRPTTSSIAMPVGHITAYNVVGTPYDSSGDFTDGYGGLVDSARGSYVGEVATDRLARLGAEMGLILDVPAVSADAITRMGWQPAGTDLDLLGECEAADGGLLYESGFGLTYVPREARYNPPVAMTIDLSGYRVAAGQSGSVLTPIYDDQQRRNYQEVVRADGSFAIAENVPAGAARRGDSVELNLYDDTGLPNIAARLLRLANVDEMRYPTSPIDLAANPDLIEQWLACDIGARIVRTNPPAPHPPGDIDQLLNGYTETLQPYAWKVAANTSPARPWHWLTDTFTRIVSSGWGTAGTGEVWTVEGTAAQYSVTGTKGRQAAATVGTLYTGHLDAGRRDIDVAGTVTIPVVPTGGAISVWVFARMTNVSNYYAANLSIATSGAATLSIVKRVAGALTGITSSASVGTHVAGNSWRIRLSVYGATVRAKAWKSITAEPSAWTVQGTDTVLTSGTRVAVAARRETGNTNSSPNIDWDDFGEVRL